LDCLPQQSQYPDDSFQQFARTLSSSLMNNPYQPQSILLDRDLLSVNSAG
jgi:hypothetical protein